MCTALSFFELADSSNFLVYSLLEVFIAAILPVDVTPMARVTTIKPGQDETNVPMTIRATRARRGTVMLQAADVSVCKA